MPFNFSQAKIQFKLQTYRSRDDGSRLGETHIAFSGTPQRDPADPHKIILVVDPCSAGTFYYEFMIRDIHCVEKLPSLVTIAGEVIPMARFWVKKRSIAVRSIPFVVENS